MVERLRNVTSQEWKIAIDQNVKVVVRRDRDYKKPKKKVFEYALSKVQTAIDAIHIAQYRNRRKIPEKYMWKFLYINPRAILFFNKPPLAMWRFAISWKPKLYKEIGYSMRNHGLSKENMKELKNLSKATKSYRKEQLRKTTTYHVRPKQQPHLMNWSKLQSLVNTDSSQGVAK